MDLKLSHCFITVHDHDEALAFYRDVLGLKVRTDTTAEGLRRVTMTTPSQPDVEIVLEPPGAGPNASAQDREELAELLGKGALRGVVFATADCDATFERVEASGAEVIQEPMDQTPGVRDCAFRDPSGNLLRFTQVR